jgi:hypothetical protein
MALGGMMQSCTSGPAPQNGQPRAKTTQIPQFVTLSDISVDYATIFRKGVPISCSNAYQGGAFYQNANFCRNCEPRHLTVVIFATVIEPLAPGGCRELGGEWLLQPSPPQKHKTTDKGWEK